MIYLKIPIEQIGTQVDTVLTGLGFTAENIDDLNNIATNLQSAEDAATAAEAARDLILALTVNATGLPEGSEPTASYADGVITLGIPDGATGPQGIQGEQGIQGIQGEQGEQGIQGITGKGIDTVTSNKVGSTTTVTVTGDFDNSPLAFTIEDGLDGDGSGDFLADGSVPMTGTLVTPEIQLTGGTGDQGKITWNADEETLDVIQNGATLQLGQELQTHVRNNSGSLISNGTVVMATGTLGASGRITVAPYDNTTDPKYIIGIATEDIGIDDDGKVTSFGKVRGIDTQAFTEGSVLYTASNGGLTSTEPTNGIKNAIAFVINSAANGALMVRVTPDNELISYNSLLDLPTIPTAVSELTNDSGYITGFTETDPIFTASQAANITATHIATLNNTSGTNTGDQDLSGYALTSSLATVATSGSYNDLSNLPTLVSTSATNTWTALQTFDSGVSINGSITEEVAVLTGDALNPANGTIQTFTMTADTTFTDSLADGQSMVLHLTNGGFTATFPTLTWISNTEPTLNTTDAFVFYKIGTTLFGAYVGMVA